MEGRDPLPLPWRGSPHGVQPEPLQRSGLIVGLRHRVSGSSGLARALTVLPSALGPGSSREPGVACAGMEQGDLRHGAGGPGGPGQVGRWAAVAGWGSLCPEPVIMGDTGSHSPFTVHKAGASRHPPCWGPTPSPCSQNISAPHPKASRMPNSCCPRGLAAFRLRGRICGDGSQERGPAAPGRWGLASSLEHVFWVHLL